MVQSLLHLVVLLWLDRATSPLLEAMGKQATVAKVSAGGNLASRLSRRFCEGEQKPLG